MEAVPEEEESCIKCQKRFTTYEKAEQAPVIIIKKDGKREAFDISKVKNGIIKACEKRNVSLDVIESMAIEVEKQVYNSVAQEVSTEKIGDMVMEQLKDVDEVAYVRFASVYRSFKDITTFMEELESLVKNKNERLLKERKSRL